MRFRGIELNIRKSLHQVSSLSLGELMTISSHLRAAWTYLGITKGMFSSRAQTRGSLTLPVIARVKRTIVSIGLVK